MSALTLEAAERIERELSREHEKAVFTYARHWRVVASVSPGDVEKLGRMVVRRLHESHELLMLHGTLVERFGPDSARAKVGAGLGARMDELVTYVMGLGAGVSDEHSASAVQDVLAVLIDAMDAG